LFSLIIFISVVNFVFSGKMAGNVPPLLVSCEVRNELFSVKDKNSCET
jgi:hypothetical protein